MYLQVSVKVIDYLFLKFGCLHFSRSYFTRTDNVYRVIALWPFGITFLWFGLLLLHCGWASHLLDETHPYKQQTDQPGNPADGPFDSVLVQPREDLPPMEQERKMREGFWQFVDDDAWQTKCSRDQLQ